MRSTGFAYSREMEAHAATGYHPRRNPMRYLLHRWVIGPPAGRWLSLNRFLLDGQAYGGLIGTVTDAARFVQMHLRDGELDGVRVLDADHARAMREIDRSTASGSISGSGGSGRRTPGTPIPRSSNT